MRTVISVVVGVVLVLGGPRFVSADPVPEIPTQLLSGARVETEGGTRLDLPPNFWIVPPDAWARMDAEMRRLQEVETRLRAENDSMKKSLRETGSRWYWIGAALATGFGAGVAYGALK